MTEEIGRRQFLRDAASGLAVAGLLSSSALAETVKRAKAGGLNVLFIMTDQHNVRTMGCSGNAEIKTPALDKLAGEGVRFSNAFCQTAQCCPSRASLFTGRYAHSHGLRWNGVPDPVDEIYWPEIFRDAGYATATIGKHHMSVSPTKHGLDHVVERPEYNKFCRANNVPNWLKKGKFMDVYVHGPAGESGVSNDQHPAGFWTNEMIKWLRTHKDKPFCGVLSYFGPHTPIAPSKPWATMYDPKTLTLPGNFEDPREEIPVSLRIQHRQGKTITLAQHRQLLAYYYGFVSQIDFNIGRVLDELDKLGLREKTLVIYTADHGEMAGEHHMWTKTVACYDGTVRIPMIVRLPGVVPAGKVRDELVGLIDLMPTLCELQGYDLPAKVQGRSLVPLLKGKDVKWRDTIFSEIGYPGKHHGRCVMAQTHKYKYVHHPNLRSKPVRALEELFDMQTDPWELKNLARDAGYATVLAGLKKQVAEWDRTTDHAPMVPITKVPKRRRPRPRRPAAGS